MKISAPYRRFELLGIQAVLDNEQQEALEYFDQAHERLENFDQVEKMRSILRDPALSPDEKEKEIQKLHFSALNPVAIEKLAVGRRLPALLTTRPLPTPRVLDYLEPAFTLVSLETKATGSTLPAAQPCGDRSIWTDRWIWTEQCASSIPDAYRIVAGDTLWSIARQVYGRPAWVRLFRANRYSVRNPHWIYPGQILAIPP
jgi:nucleoid-associated protein YgaU